MSEIRSSGTLRPSRLVPFFMLIAGLVLLWMGNQEYQQFQNEVESYVSARPGNRTLWFLVLGASALVAGAVGLMRDRVV